MASFGFGFRRRRGPSSSARWAFLMLERIGPMEEPDVLYMTRLRLVQTPWFGVYLHRIHMPDGARELHDHPWPFWSLVLMGSYHEARPARELDRDRRGPDRRVGPVIVRKRRWLSLARRRARDAHRITSISRWPLVTLVVAGRRDPQGWGFQTDAGWVSAPEYFSRAAGAAPAAPEK